MIFRTVAIAALAVSLTLAAAVAGKRCLALPRGAAQSHATPSPTPADLSKHRAFLDSLRQPAIRLVRSTRRDFSRIGGLPTLPARVAWPTRKGKALAFLCQIDLAAVTAVAGASDLPRAGYLYFFYAAEQDSWGFDPKDRPSWRVLYVETLAQARDVAPPSALPEGGAYAAVPVGFRVVQAYPDLQDDRLDPLKLTDAEAEAYESLRLQALGEGLGHQLLGYPETIQGNDMDLESQLASNGLYVGDAAGYRSPQATALAAGRSDWRLLLQLDSDDDAKMMWGDSGRLYFWINKADLARRDFSKVWMILQCY